jgi:hypothetical protein
VLEILGFFFFIPGNGAQEFIYTRGVELYPITEQLIVLIARPWQRKTVKPGVVENIHFCSR